MALYDIPFYVKVDGDMGNIMIVVARLQRVLRQHKVPEAAIHSITADIYALNSYTAQLGMIAQIVNFNQGQFNGLK